MKKTLFVLSALTATATMVMAQDVTLGTLLDEMVDRDRLTRFPSPEYTSRMYSSYDRATVAKDKPGWFANGDASQFMREENNNGRRELVMLDTQGPGSVVRWWHTGDNDQGTTLRVYLDGNAEPVFSGKLRDFISGEKLAGAPLSAYLSSGRNLYLPIPYAKSCKITYESPHVWAQEHGEPCYYNIEVRTYDPDIKVESFTMDILKREQDKIAKVNATLNESLEIPGAAVGAFDGVIQPGKTLTKTVTGAAAVKLLSFALTAGDGEPGKEGWRAALRSTIIEMSFDGTRTVWAPAGDFFGTGYRFTPYKTHYTEVKADGRMFAAWIMPFQKEFTLTIRNLGRQDVKVSQSVLLTAPYQWDDGSMYFGAGWTEHNRTRTRKDNEFEKGDHQDINYVTLSGEGVLVGTGVTIFNTCNDWWGEGDEKIFIDGEVFPSFIGTGSEDYYGYAWCNGTPFMHPFLAQPYGNGNGNIDISINTRYRALDAIPFKKSIQFDMELWHWADTIVNYAPVTMWYMKSGGLSNRGVETELAKLPIVTTRDDVYGITTISEGRLEGELLNCSTTQGRAAGQSMGVWSNGRQMWWTDGKPGAEMTIPFHMTEDGKRHLTVCMTRAVDYGKVDIGVNGEWLAKDVDGFVEGPVSVKTVDLGVLDLKKGENKLVVKVVGKNEKMTGDRYMFGLDYIDVKKP